MRIGIISDVHDNIWALPPLLEALSECEALLCLGDLCAPFTLAYIAEGFAGPIHLVFGNNDGDKLHIAQVAAKTGRTTLHGDLAELILGGQRIALTHYPNIGRALAESRLYDLVCHGHDHTRAITPVGEALLVNPGEVMGRDGVHSAAIYDTERHAAKLIEQPRRI